MALRRVGPGHIFPGTIHFASTKILGDRATPPQGYYRVIDTLGQWLDDHLTIPGLPVWVSVVLIAMVLAAISVGVTMVALIYLPTDYFCGTKPPDGLRVRHPILRWTLRITRNLLGWFLVILGILLSFPGIPGQGLLTILLGLILVEFPGKRRLEQKFVRWPRIRNAVNSLRQRFGREPLKLEPDSKPE